MEDLQARIFQRLKVSVCERLKISICQELNLWICQMPVMGTNRTWRAAKAGRNKIHPKRKPPYIILNNKRARHV